MRVLVFLLFNSLAFLPSLVFAQNQPISRAKLVQEAQKEGKAVFYTAASAADANILKAAFEKKYPAINLEYYRAGKDRLLNRYLTEVRAGQYLPDVYQSSVFPMTTLVQKGLLGRYLSPEREAYSDEFRNKEGYWTGIYLNALTIAYHTRLVRGDEIPKGHQDLLQPKWKGKMGIDLNKTEWYAAMLQLMGEDKGRAYMEALSKQDVQAREGNTLIGNLLAAGEFPLVVSQYPTSVEELKKKGAPIEWLPLQPYFVYTIAIGLTARPPHPAAGRLLVDFLLSEEGQLIMQGLSRIPARKNILPDPPRLIQGHKLLVVKPVSNEHYTQFNNEYHKYFR